MSLVKSEDDKKWINAFVAIIAILAGFITVRFLEQMGEWFDLEAKVNYFVGITQGIGILVALATFLVIIKNSNAYAYLNEVYSELVKVVWPDKDSVFKVTIGIVIGLVLISGVFVSVDFLFRKMLELIY